MAASKVFTKSTDTGKKENGMIPRSGNYLVDMYDDQLDAEKKEREQDDE